MKKVAIICFLVLPGMLINCKDDNPTCPELSIEGAFPFSAPPSGPVLIKGTGFNQDDITVRFGTQNADILENSKNYISTKVPPGLLGVVELSVSNAQGCLVTRNFEVSSLNPNSVPGSPPVYLIPPSGFSFPQQIPMNQRLEFYNVYDLTHSITVPNFQDVMVNASGSEDWNGVVSPVSGNVNLPKNEINMKIDRTVNDDELMGGFYTVTLKVNGVERKDNFFIAFSSVTGRQYVFDIIP